jgi:hypothetical protein
MSDRSRLAETDLSQAVSVESLRPKLPDRPKVIRVGARSYVDHTGEDAILVQVVLEDDTTDEELKSEQMEQIEAAIRSALEADVRFPYFRFATVQEIESEADEDDDSELEGPIST